MLDLEHTRTVFVIGDRVRRSRSDQIGAVASEEISSCIMVRLNDGDTELWRFDDVARL